MDDRERVVRWQDTEVGDAHEAIKSVVDSLQITQDGIRQKCRDLLTLYQGQADDSGPQLDGFGLDGLSFNVVQSCSDTMCSHILQNRVRPLFLTDGGSYDLKNQAQGMQRGVEAQFSTSGIWGPLGEDICSDGVVWGTTGVFVWPDARNMRVVYRRVLPWEIHISPDESESRSPRSLVYVTRESREVLLEAYGDDPEAVEAIAAAPAAPYDAARWETPVQGDPIADEILVYRAWHLPSGRVDRDDPAVWGYDKDGDRVEVPHDGRAVVSIEGATLSDDAYPYEYFPVSFFRPRRKRLGFWGRGIAEQLVGHQLEITRTLRRIQGILQLHAKPIVVLWLAAKINPHKFAKSDWARILTSRQPGNQAIQYITPQSIPAELIAHLQRMIEYAYRVTGISELSASAVRQPNLESGKAHQLLLDAESVRHTPVFKAWEQFHVDLANLTVDAYRILHERAKEEKRSFTVVWEGDKQLESIDWGEVDLGETRYRLRTWPTNFFAKTPAARMAQVQELLGSELLDREQALEMLDFPDIESAVDERRAAWRAVKAKVDFAVSGDMEEAIPSPYTNLQLLQRIAIARYQMLEADQAGSEVLDRVRWLIEHTQELIKGPEAENAPPPGPPAGGGMPAASPVAPSMPAPPMASAA